MFPQGIHLYSTSHVALPMWEGAEGKAVGFLQQLNCNSNCNILLVAGGLSIMLQISKEASAMSYVQLPALQVSNEALNRSGQSASLLPNVHTQAIQ